MKQSLLFLLFIAITSPSYAALKSEGKTHLTVNRQEATALITVDSGFHFNIQAPTFLETNKIKQTPATLTEMQLSFKWKGDLAKDANFNYYVCDDAKTVCEPHSDSPFNTALKNEIQTSKKLSSSSVTLDKDGFILNNFDAALNIAQKKNLPILIDFTASWCLACIRLVHETFNTSKFKKAATKFILIKIDVD